MRGVVPATVLCAIEQHSGKPLHETFDLVCGTSTGGILACLIAAGIPAKQARDFYFKAGPRIFKTSALRKIYSLGSLLHTKYPADDLERELKAAIGTGLMSSAQTHLMVTSMTATRRAEMIKSWEPDFAELPMWKAAQMTSSAQTFFPQAEALGEKWLDGGNVRNAPMVCALAEALDLWPSEPLRLIHLGTGYNTHPEPLPNGGAAFWAANIFEATTNADDSFDTYICEKMQRVIPGFRFFKLDVPILRFPPMDDASPDTLKDLCGSTVVSMRVTGNDHRLYDAIFGE